MKKNEFLKKWSKRASDDGPTELFERDVESLVRDTVRASVTGISRGIKQASRKYHGRERAILEAISEEVVPSVERALAKLYE